MSDQPTPKPPWEWEQHTPRTRLENCVCIAMEDGYRANAKRAWAELCDLRTRLAALERVMKAAESLVMQNYRGPEDYDELRAAIDAAKST